MAWTSNQLSIAVLTDTRRNLQYVASKQMERYSIKAYIPAHMRVMTHFLHGHMKHKRSMG